MAGRLTTHVLDLAQGRPAAHLAIELWHLGPQYGTRELLKMACTNTDGRTDIPLLVGDELKIGYYELVFMIGPYFARQALAIATPPFLDSVPVRFGVADNTAHYHVPLLTTPWGYSTYRGS